MLGVKMHFRTNLLHEKRMHKLPELEYLRMFLVVLVLQ